MLICDITQSFEPNHGPVFKKNYIYGAAGECHSIKTNLLFALRHRWLREKLVALPVALAEDAGGI